MSRSKPILTCNTNCQVPAEDFHSLYTATSIPSYAGSEVKSSSGPSGTSRVDHSTTPRTFPVIITNSDGQNLFNAEIKFSSNRVITALSATRSTVSFSVDVTASLDVPTGTSLNDVSLP